MIRLLGILMMVGVLVGCGEEIKLTYDNGQVKIDGNLVDGKEEGKWVWYYESGKIEQEVNFVDGKKEGKEVWYYKSGKVQWERNFVDGKKEGKWFWYDEEGKIIDEDIYENNVCVEMCEGDIFE